MGRPWQRPLPLLLLPALLLSPGASAWGGWAPAAAAPRFAVVPAAQAREGRGHLDSLQQGAGTEGFLDRVLGTNCFSQAVAQLTADCRRMEQEAKTRLALSLMNCQLQVQQAQTYPCHRRHTIKECTEGLSDRAHALFVEFLTHADSMCLYIQNQNFERYTENMLDRLAEGAGYARDQLALVARTTGQLGKDTAALQAKAEAALGLLHQQQELEEESLRMAREARAESAAFFQSLDAKQQRNLDLQDAAIKRQQALEVGQAATLRLLEEAEGHMGGLFELVEGRAADLAAAAGRQAEAQRQLAGELGGLLDSSRSIRSAVDVVIGYQQRSDSVLMRLLGRSYRLEDAAFYAAGLLAAMAAGTSPATARAKVPVMAVMGASLLGERLLLDRLHLLLDIDEAGEIVMSLPLPAWLSRLPSMPASPLRLNFKWTVRWAAVALGTVILLFCLLSYRDFERESYRLLRQLEEDQRRRHNEFLSLISRQRVELAAMLGSAGTGAPRGSGKAAPGGKQPAAVAAAVHGSQGRGALPSMLDGGEAGGGQLVPSAAGRAAPVARGWLEAVAEASDDDDGEEEEQAQQGRGGFGYGKAQLASVAPAAWGASPGAVATPAGKAGTKAAAGGRPYQPPPARQAAAVPASRKRGPSGDVEAGAAAGGGPAKRRAAAGRRASQSDDAVEAMAVDDVGERNQPAPKGAAERRQGRGRRARRGSADVAATGGSSGAAPLRRVRRS